MIKESNDIPSQITAKQALPFGGAGRRASIIIPIYNVETTIESCLLSVIGQGLNDLEIILVDDGSTDGSATIAKKFADEHESVKYIRQENQGLSAARNTGIKASCGEFITFVDSDDWLMENTYAPLLRILAEKPDCDILEYSFVKSRSGKEEQFVLSEETYTDARSYWLQGKAYLHTYAWNKLFRRTLFLPSDEEPVLFQEGYIFEDAEFMGRLLQTNPTIVTTSHQGYVYQQNPKGITATADGKKLTMLLEAHLNAAHNLNLDFMKPQSSRPLVSDDEAPLYLSLLNIQISVCQRTHSAPILPDCKVRLSNANGIVMKLKAFILNLLGLNTLCRLW